MTDREKFEAWFTSSGNEDVPGWVAQGLWQAWQAALASQQPADDGWIEWGGGECPVAGGDVVDVMLRNKALSSMRYAGNLRWELDGDASDIIAYRVVKP